MKSRRGKALVKIIAEINETESRKKQKKNETRKTLPYKDKIKNGKHLGNLTNKKKQGPHLKAKREQRNTKNTIHINLIAYKMELSLKNYKTSKFTQNEIDDIKFYISLKINLFLIIQIKNQS